MFIKKIFVFNKGLCIGILSFLLLYFIINYKWGAVATPVYQFGMYSTPFHLKDTQQVYLIYLDGKQLDYNKYNNYEKDFIQIYLKNYFNNEVVNEHIFETFKSSLSKIGIGDFMYKKDYTNKLTDADFLAWYATQLKQLTQESFKKIEIVKQGYVYNKGNMEAVQLPKKLAEYVFN